MPAMKPEDCDHLVAEYINSGNVEGAVELYEANATFVAEPGKPVTGPRRDPRFDGRHDGRQAEADDESSDRRAKRRAGAFGF